VRSSNRIGRRIGLVAGLALAGFAGWLALERFSPSERQANAAAPTRPTAPSIPVVAGEARLADVPVFLRGLGTVAPLNSVLIRSRVDGQLIRIHFNEGQDVRAGDVIAELDPRPFEASLAQVQATRLKDQAQLENARLDFQRASRLAATGSASGQQVDTARALTAQLEAAVKADQAAIDMAQIQLDYSHIKAPIDGRAGTRLVDVGNIVHASDANGIVAINQLHPINVEFSLPADTLSRIRSLLQAGEVAVTAEDSAGADLATGKLVVIDNQINTATATIRYKAAFDNAGDVLWPGQFVNARVHLQTKHDALTVPTPAVVRGPEGAYVFVIGPDRVIAKQPVKVELTTKDVAVIAEGLTPGQRIVIDGQYRIQAGSLVELLPPAAPVGVN
jgi:multidrug efflux system membrane fusion protein